MKYLGFLLFLITVVGFLLFYNFRYLPLQDDLAKQLTENQMWQAEIQDLKKKITEREVREPTRFVFLDDELFISGSKSFQLSSSGEATLKAILNDLQKTSEAIIIAGHTDNTPVRTELKARYSTNRELSAIKAGSVAKYLESWGVKRDRIVISGYGEFQPVETNDTQEGRRKNRRVEIVVRE